MRQKTNVRRRWRRNQGAVTGQMFHGKTRAGASERCGKERAGRKSRLNYENENVL